MLFRLAYLAVTNALALVRLLPMSDYDKDIEILALRHQIGVLQRQLGPRRPRFQPADRAFLAALLHRLPARALRELRLLVRPDTVLRWHRDLIRQRWTYPSPRRRGLDPAVTEAQGVLACDFLTVETIGLTRLCVQIRHRT